MLLPVFGSARNRRRLGWAAGCAAVAAGIAAGIVLVPSSGRTVPVVHVEAAEQVVRVPPSVPLTAARKHAVDSILATFVPAAVERKDPKRALPLVTHSFRDGISDAEWNSGNLPVFPYHPRDGWGWRLDYSHANEVSVDLLLHPARTETLGAIAYTVVFVKRGDRWLIDSFVPAASFAAERKTPKILAQPDFSPWLDNRGKGTLDAKWLVLPAALLALIVLVPLAVIVANWRRGRRAWKQYRLSSR
jgi:hypothetical protein